MAETRWSLLILDDSPSRKKNWKLTQEAFNNLLAHLDPDRGKAGDKYEILRFKIIRFFERRNCKDAEVLANESIDRVSRRIEEGKIIESITSYAYGVAKMIYMEYLKAQDEERKILANMPPPPEPDPEPGPQLQAILAYLNSCMNRLSEDDRNLFIRYHPEDDSEKINNRKMLAEEKGIHLNALRIRAHRIKNRLKRCINKCLKDQSQ